MCDTISVSESMCLVPTDILFPVTSTVPTRLPMAQRGLLPEELELLSDCVTVTHKAHEVRGNTGEGMQGAVSSHTSAAEQLTSPQPNPPRPSGSTHTLSQSCQTSDSGGKKMKLR